MNTDDLIKTIKQQRKNLNKKLEKLLNDDNENENTLFHNRHSKYKNDEKKEFTVGIIIILAIILIASIGYYFLFFQPAMQELNNAKNNKINEVNMLFTNDLTVDPNKQAIISQIDSASSIEEVNNIDVNAMAYPILKKHLQEQINTSKDKYNRIQFNYNNTTTIMDVDDANNKLKSMDANELTLTNITKVDTVIVPLSITRKQAASGLIKESDIVDIYKISNNSNDVQENMETKQNNTTTQDVDSNNTTQIPITVQPKSTNDSSKIVGGSKIVSILRSKDSGTIDFNTQLGQTPKSRNYTQEIKTDVYQAILSKASGTLSEKEVKILMENYGWRLSEYERTSNIGDLNAEYLVMLEVPRESVEEILTNMDNLILTIPTYDAPSWVNLK